MQLPVRQREQDMERCGRERQISLWQAADVSFPDYGFPLLADTTISMFDIVPNVPTTAVPVQGCQTSAKLVIAAA